MSLEKQAVDSLSELEMSGTEMENHSNKSLLATEEGDGAKFVDLGQGACRVIKH